MKFRIITIAMCIVILICGGCANYQQFVGNTSNDNKEVVNSVTLNDINNDGKRERIILEDGKIVLLSETNVLGRFEPNTDLNYESVSASVIDIDDDKVMEIVLSAYVDVEHNLDKIVCVYIIDRNDNGEYYVRKMPEELANMYSYSGVNAVILPSEEYKYKIKCLSYEFDIDASRIYGLSVMEHENREKLDEKWSDMLEKNLVGEVAGVLDVQIVRMANGDSCIRYYEQAKGIDRRTIGKLLVDVKFDKNGTYEIQRVDFMESVDMQP